MSNSNPRSPSSNRPSNAAPAATAQSQADAPTIMFIPPQAFEKDPEMRHYIRALMSGNMFTSSWGFGKLEQKGYPRGYLNSLRDTGYRWRNMQPPVGLQFGLEPADEEIVAMLPFEPRPGQTPAMNTSHGSMAPAAQKSHEYMIPLASLGLGVTNMGSDLYIMLKDATALKHALSEAQMIRTVNGKRHIWRMRMNGGHPIVDPNTQKIASLTRQLNTLKVVRALGKAAVVGGVVLSLDTALERNDMKGWSKFGLDMVMVGVAYIPVVGWVVSGIYFIADAALNLCGIDWWSAVYDRVVAPSTAMDIAMLDALTMALH